MDVRPPLDTSLVEFEINSLDGSTSETVYAYTTECVTGNMQVVDWNLYKTKWTHLQMIDVPEPAPRSIADMLTVADHSYLLYSLWDVRGKPGEPVARLPLLGWTGLDSPEMDPGGIQTNFTFLVNDPHELNNLVRRFWDIEEPKESRLSNQRRSLPEIQLLRPCPLKIAAKVLGCYGRPKTMNYQTTSTWLCAACRTQRNNFEVP